MQLKFEGQTHSIDANTLINVLTHYQTVVNVANKQLGGGEKEIKLQINAIEKGSFVVDISLVQNIIEQLFSHDSVSYIADLCGVVGGIYATYHWFKGRPCITDDDNKQIETLIKNNKDCVIQVYNQPLVREAISRSIETSNADGCVEGFSVIEDNKTKTVFRREEFADYIYDDFDKEESIPDERHVEEDVNLVIVSLSFERGSQWQFMYHGFKIKTIVKDDALMEQIDRGVRFGKGDAIFVRLKITQRFNKSFGAYENKSFKISKFYKIVEVPKQQELDLE